MRTLKIYWLRASAAVLTLMLGLGLFVNAMEKDGGAATEANQPTEVPYYYTGPEAPDLADLQNLGNWSTSQEPNHTCGEESDIPCFIMADSETSLNSKLQAANNVGDVLNESPSRRENQ
ncbi:hypothetical protein FXV77_06985 [Sphingobacterium phlebotomi]|uniref:Uncharacterized protein n=1 Tax=Sphingobacterium phlebotomi TaxID=2605433 RepID=A0A5D4H8K8_9SPHI|nr:hypothetical protein [Sphingobacterium phlebotomi]TYR36917.1 hypothetical protein FXV77_06985 [Sphingobacterium phlebotomi]